VDILGDRQAEQAGAFPPSESDKVLGEIIAPPGLDIWGEQQVQGEMADHQTLLPSPSQQQGGANYTCTVSSDCPGVCNPNVDCPCYRTCVGGACMQVCDDGNGPTQEEEEEEELEYCACDASWSLEGSEACKEVPGCPAKACDGDERGPWCFMSPGATACKDRNGFNISADWFLCTPDEVMAVLPSPGAQAELHWDGEAGGFTYMGEELLPSPSPEALSAEL
jgi:hypothetical protein